MYDENLLSPDELLEALDKIPPARNGYRLMRDLGSHLIHQAIAHCKGNSTDTVDLLKVRYSDWSWHLEGMVEYQTHIARYRNQMIDRAEEKLSQKVDNGEMSAITFVLDRLGKERGYSKEITHITTGSGDKEQATFSADQLTLDELKELERLKTKMLIDNT